MIQFREHQERGASDIRAAFRSGFKAPLYVAPTGSGKTVLFSGICHGAMSKGKSVAIIAHRGELLEQISGTLERFDVPHSFIAAGEPYDPRKIVQVASSQTLVRRVSSLPAPDLLLIDEAHHATLKNTIGKIIKAWGCKRIGFTATPSRLSGEGLGDVFDTMILGPTVSELTDIGLLSPARAYAPPGADLTNLHVRAGDFVHAESEAAMDKPTITGDAVQHYRKHADGLPFVAFCCSLKHAAHVVADFRAAGIDAVDIHGQMAKGVRHEIVRDFRTGRLRGLVSVDLISEGFDVPGIHAGIFLRPTASRTLWFQQIGRILRTAEGKREAIALDHAGNILRHGLPTDDQQWTLEGRTKGNAKADPSVSVRICPQCYSASNSRSLTCGECGFRPEPEGRTVAQEAGELVLVESAQRSLRDEEREVTSLEGLIALGRKRGYANAGWWAVMKMKARERKRA